jgi:hypothetical protein
MAVPRRTLPSTSSRSSHLTERRFSRSPAASAGDDARRPRSGPIRLCLRAARSPPRPAWYRLFATTSYRSCPRCCSHALAHSRPSRREPSTLTSIPNCWRSTTRTQQRPRRRVAPALRARPGTPCALVASPHGRRRAVAGRASSRSSSRAKSRGARGAAGSLQCLRVRRQTRSRGASRPAAVRPTSRRLRARP